MLKRRILGPISVVALAAFVAAGCGNSVPEGAICSVDGDPIQQEKFDALVSQAKRNYKNQGQKFPKKGSTEYTQLRTQAVGYLIEQELYEQRADELGVSVKKKDVDERLKQLKQSFFQGDKKKYAAELKKQGLSEKDVRENIEQQILTQKLFEKVTEDVKVSDKKAEAYYEDNEEQYKTPASREVAHILVKGKKQADDVYAQVKGGDEKAFAKVAKKLSQDPSSAQNGGVLTANKGQLVPEFEKVAFDLEVGEVSKPVKTSFGYHVITARSEVKDEKKQSFKEVEEQIKQTLQQEQRSKRMQEWREDMLKDAEEKVNCKKGYVWAQTATTDTTKTSEDGPQAEPEATTADTSGGDTTADEKAASDDTSDDESGDKADAEADATVEAGSDDASEGDAADKKAE